MGFWLDTLVRRVRIPYPVFFGLINLIEIERFVPTSKRCHACGFINDTLKLTTRAWICPACNLTLDRDLNAAKNIKIIGLQSIKSPREPRVGPVELLALAEASKQETLSFKAG